MEPLTMALIAAANFAVSAVGSAGKKGIQDAQTDVEVEQAKLESEKTAYDITKAFRESTSYNLALSAMGFGGVSGFKQTMAGSSAALGRDLRAVEKQQRFISISGDSAKAGAATNAFTSNATAAISSVLLAKDLGLFSGKSGVAPPKPGGFKLGGGK